MSKEILGIHHVTAIAGDPQRNVDFYTGVLGLRLVKLTVNYDDPQTYHFYYGDAHGTPGTILTFFPWPRAKKGRQGHGQVTVTAFSVPEPSLDFWAKRLSEQGVEFEGPYGRFEEHKHFSPGPALRAFDTRLGRTAVLICNDAWQAPLAYVAAHDGARLLIVPAASSLESADGTDPAELERDWGDLLRFHARFLQAWVVFVNRVGDEAGVTFWGGSRVIDPWGRVVAQAPRGEEALVYADLDVSAVRRRRRELPLLKEPRLGLIRREIDRLIDADA